MKITCTLLASLLLGCTAFADGQYSLAVMQDPHGGTRLLYYRTTSMDPGTSVALETASGGLGGSVQMTPIASDQTLRFVIGTNQHGQSTSAYIPQNSNFGPARQ